MKYTLDMKRVTVLSNGFQADYVSDLVNAMAENSIQVDLIGGNRHENIIYKSGVTFFNLRGDAQNSNVLKKYIEYAYYCLRVVHFVYKRKHQPVLLIYLYRPFIEGILLCGLLKLRKVKLYLIAHNILPHDASPLINVPLHHIVYRLIMNHLFVHSTHLKMRVEEKFKITKKKVTFVNLGISPVKNSTVYSKKDARQHLGLQSEDTVLLVFGMLSPYKGTHFLLEMIGKNDLRVKVLIAGKARDVYEQKLMGIQNQYKITDRVIRHNEYVPEEKIVLYFRAADIVVLPYFEESQSAVLFTSFACGRPVLGSKNGTFDDYIVSGLTGELFKMGNEAEFIEKIKYMVSNSHLYDDEHIIRLTNEMYKWSTSAEIMGHTIS